MKRQKRQAALTRLWAFAAALCLAFAGLIGVGAAPAQAASGNILPPFDLGQTWNICQGYDGSVSHTGTSQYGLDLTGAGCDNSATGRNVRAPLAGTVLYYQASYGNLCINTTDGRSVTLTHIDGSVTSGTVTAGQVVGTVAPAGTRGNAGVAHIHFQMWSSPGCYNSSVMPFDSAHNARICGAPDLTASGPNGGNGTWSGTSFTGQDCTSSSPQGLQRPSAISDSATGRNIFYVGADNQIWQWSVQGGSWTNFKLTGTGASSSVAPNTSPSAVSDSSSGRNVFYVGSDNAIWQWSVQGGQWHNFRLGGSVAPNTSPVAISDSATGRNIFYVGADNQIWQWSVQGGSWTNFKLTGTGGNAAVAAGTSPAAISDSASGRNVFYTGADQQIWQWSIQSGQWHNFKLTGTGGNTAAAAGTSPSAVSDSSSGRNVFYTGADQQIWQWSVQNSQWHNFKLTGTGGNTAAATGSSPSAVTDSTNGPNVFYTGGDNRVWQWSVQSGQWNNFKLTGTGASSSVMSGTSPGAVVDSSTGRNVFYFDPSRMIWQWSVQNSQWHNFKME